MREGGQPCLGFAGSRWVREVGTFGREREREATNGEWLGAPGRNILGKFINFISQKRQRRDNKNKNEPDDKNAHGVHLGPR